LTHGDGWGWDGSTSCRVESADTSTNTNNGGTQSVATTDASCVDTDPIGDGWGWNGSTSCRVNNNSSVVNNDTGSTGNDHTFPLRSDDGIWPVCYSDRTNNNQSWYLQYSHSSGSIEPCIRRCAGDSSGGSGHGGWGNSCVATDSAEGDDTYVPLYVDGQRRTFSSNLSRDRLIRNGFGWSCKRQTRSGNDGTFRDSGHAFTVKYHADGTLDYGVGDSWSSSWWQSWWTDTSWLTWTTSGRTLELLTVPSQSYRNVRFENKDGAERLRMYKTTEERIDCR